MATRRSAAALPVLLLVSVLSHSLTSVATPAGPATPVSLSALVEQRNSLTAELEQYQRTIAVLQTDDTPPEQSSNPAVRKLAEEVVRLQETLVNVMEREVTLLQQEISQARVAQQSKSVTIVDEAPPPDPVETRPIVMHATEAPPDTASDHVERLHELLEDYHAELQEAANTLPTDQELELREQALRQAQALESIPYSVNKVRLTGSEGSTALTQITRRLSDPTIPESRRDIAPICVIRTRLFGNLIGSENRSLKPVGKNHYIALVRLQPGDTKLSIMDNNWKVRLSHDSEAQDFLITLYQPPGGKSELHVFAVEELLAVDRPHIPAWLPDDIQLQAYSG